MRRAIGNRKIFIMCLVLVCAIFVAGIYGLRGEVVYRASAQTFASTHEINTPADLLALADEVNKGLYDGYYGITILLTDDIDIGDICRESDRGAGWIPIGTSTYPFKGTFDGNGHSINGLYIDKEDTERVGLFGNTHFNAVLTDFTVNGVVKGSNYTGGIVGYNQAKIQNCVNSVAVDAKDGSMHLGGIAGYNSGSIVRSGNTADIAAGFVNFVAGIAGSNIGSIKECYNTADLYTTDSVIGGIVGNNSSQGTVEICLNGGRVSGKANAGGIVGSNYGSILNVFNSGNVESVNGTAGGITGYNDASGTAAYALSAAKVSGAGDVAAVCGYNLGIVRAAFFDNSIFDGALLNGIAAEDSAGFSTRILSHSNVLTAEDKLKKLTDSDPDVWTKNSVEEQNCYYPQLTYFFDALPSISGNISFLERTQLSSADVSLGKTSFVYDGTEHTADIYYGDILLEYQSDYTATYIDNVNTGEAQIEIAFLNSLSGNAVKSFTIKPSVLTVEWDRREFVYDGEAHMPKLNVTDGLAYGETVTFDYNDPIAVNAGEYSIIAILTDNPQNANYTLPDTRLNFEILQAEISVDWTSEELVYNGAPQRPVAFVSTGQVGDEEITFRYEGEDNINAGEQKVTAFLEDTPINRNYSFAGDTHIYVISKRPIAIEWEDTALCYNGFAQYPKAEVCSGKIEGDEIVFDYFGYANNVAANSSDGYTVTVDLADTQANSNYEFAAESHGYFIQKAPLAIAWWDSVLTYSGLPQYPAFYIEHGLIGEEEIIFELSDYSANINASKGNAYTVKVSLADNSVNANYSLAEASISYDIDKAQFDIDSVSFGSRTLGYDGEIKRIEIDGDLPIGVNVIYQNNVFTDIGEYTVTAKFTVDSDNYLPLDNDTLQATVYVAQMIYEDPSSGIVAVNKDAPNSLLRLTLDSLKKSTLKESGKRRLIAYRVGFGGGKAEFSVPVAQKAEGIKVLCKNSSGEVFAVDFEFAEGRIVFSAQDVIEFAVLADRDLTALWIILGVAGAIASITVVVLAVFVYRRRRRLDRVPSEQTNVQALPISATDVALTATEKKESAVATDESAADLIEEDRVIEQTQGSDKNTSDGGEFIFDGVRCISFDWFIKSLDIKTVSKQERVCAGDEYALLLTEAKPKSVAYWRGKRYRIGSLEYKELMDRAKEAANEKN